MTDYLELLLERQQEEEEKRDALRLGAEGVFPQKKRGRTARTRGSEPRTARSRGAEEAGSGTERAWVEAMAAERAEADRPEAATAAKRGLGTVWPEAAAAGKLREAAEASDRRDAADRLDRALEKAVDALDRTGDETRRALELSGLSAERAASPAEGTAVLARRLSEVALASAAPPARTWFAAETEVGSPMADWEEFDRRLERDARRYDGGMGMY